MTARRWMLPFLIGLSLSLGACAASPEQLAQDLQRAFEGGAFVVNKTDGVWDYGGMRFTVSYPAP